MIIAKDFASKFAVAFVAIAMLFTLVAPAVNAQESSEDLQKTIADLLKQVAELEGKMGDDKAASSASCAAIPAPLTMGSTGANVTALQNWLIGEGEAIAAGATGYFGAQTKMALASWQGKNSVSPAVGYYGPITAAAIAASCDDEDATDEDEDDEDMSGDLSGEGSLNDGDTDLDDASDDELMEGEEDGELATLTLGADDGDIEVSRLDLSLVDTSTGTANEDLWDTFETISLWVDGDMIGEFEADDEDNYLNEEAGTFRISGLDLVIMEDEEVEIVIAATVMSSVDDAGVTNKADWTLDVDDIRYFDADGVATDDSIDAETTAVTFEVVEEGIDDDAEIKSNSDTPEAATLKVDDKGSDSDEFDVHVFDIDVDEDSSDLVFADMAYAEVTVTGAGVGTSVGATYNDVVESVYMTIGGETVEGDNITALTGSVAGVAVATVNYEFDFEDVELPAGEVTEATISIVFKGQDDGAYSNGIEVETDVDGATWEVEGISGDADVLTGTDTSETFTLANVVPVISDVTSEVDRNEAGTAGTISFEFTVEADGDEDVVLALADVVTTITGTDATIDTSTLTKVAGDATGTGPFTIQDGDEATFVLDVTFTTVNSGDNGTYRVTLDSILGVEVDETSTGLSLTNTTP